MSELKTVAQLLDIGDTIIGADNELFSVIDIDYLETHRIVLYLETVDKKEPIKMHTRAEIPFTIKI